MRKALAIVVAAALVAAGVAASGCGKGTDPAAWLEECRRAADGYASDGGYLRFQQEAEYRLETPEGVFDQKIVIEGEGILPDRQAYAYRETVSSSKVPGQMQENAFSYRTLDGGKTAFVEGAQLSAQLGVAGWIHYTPPEGQNRYFDYLGLVERLTGAGGEAEWLGYEEVEGARCARLRYTVGGRELLDLQLQNDPSFLQRYGDVDLGHLLGDLRVEMWIREADDLPQRVAMEQALTLQEDTGSTSRFLIRFSGYGEEPPAPIEQPAFFTEAG